MPRDDQIKTREQYKYARSALGWNLRYMLLVVAAFVLVGAAVIGGLGLLFVFEHYFFTHILDLPDVYLLFLNVPVVIIGTVEYVLHNHAIMQTVLRRFLNPVTEPPSEVELLKETIANLTESLDQLQAVHEKRVEQLNEEDGGSLPNRLSP